MTVHELEEKIRKLRKDYWDGNCTTPDSEYDALVEELRSIDPQNPLLVTPEHGDLKGRKKVAHAVPMLSLQKVYTEGELRKWMESVSRSPNEFFLVQPKLDGNSCHYDHGQYSTRGDGNVGEDVTDVCLAMCRQELQNGFDHKDDFYGEIVIKKSDFNTIYKNVKRDNGETFKNSRNAVAGILNADNCDFYAKQGAVLTLVDYDKYSLRMKMCEFDLKWGLFKSYISKLDYPTDGIVVKIEDPYWRENQGYTAHHPKGAMAFKFENSSAQTRLKDIEYGMGKEFITATAIFEPVNLNGVTVSRAVVPMNSKTLPCIMKGNYNLDATLTVERAGDVIPHITSVSPAPTSVFFTIDKCPFCGGEIEVLESGVRCKNDNCQRKKVHRLYDALVQLGIKNVGEATVAAICNKFASDASLYWWMFSIPTMKDKIAKLEGFGDTSAQIVIDETKKVMDTATMPQYIAAMGIPNVGIRIGTEIEKEYRTVEEFTEHTTLPRLANLDGVGTVMAQRIFNWLYNDNNMNRQSMLDLSKLFKFETHGNGEGQAVAQSVNAKGTVCFTGEMRMKRSEMQKIAKNAGYTPVNGVTKNLDLLVVADNAEWCSGKQSTAIRYGVRIMKESDFLNFCKN